MLDTLAFIAIAALFALGGIYVHACESLKGKPS